MNQADTPNNGDLNLPKSNLACPFYSVLPNDNMALPKLPPAKSVEPDSESLPEKNKGANLDDSQVIDSHLHQMLTSDDELSTQLDDVSQSYSQLKNSHSDWVAEPDSEKQAAIDSEFQKLLRLNQELSSANNELYEQVQQLTTALTESEKVLQWQKKRASVTESILKQQNQEVAAAQEQINSLFQQLETSVQTVQRQETLIETYKSQLEINQQRLAQLERECAKIQTNYNEQSHQLLQSENGCRELRTRLLRQQRQTLQFKAALEKCLEPIKSDDSLDAISIEDTPTRYSRQASSFANAQPIQPWSGETESADVLNHLWDEFSASPPDSSNNPEPTELSSEDSAANSHTPTPTEETATSEDDDSTTPKIFSSLEPSNLEAQLDSVIQMFFANNATSASPQPSAQNDAKSDVDVTPFWETVATPILDDEVTPTITVIDTTAEESEDYWRQESQFQPFEFSANASPQDSSSQDDSNFGSPSPLLYPRRPAKRRKSLAAVELPNFRSKSQNNS